MTIDESEWDIEEKITVSVKSGAEKPRPDFPKIRTLVLPSWDFICDAGVKIKLEAKRK
jgi:hypothetical protein